MELVDIFDMAKTDILLRYEAMFHHETETYHSLKVPRGWLLHLHWCLQEIEKKGLRIHISDFFWNDKELRASFYPGGDLHAEQYFQELLTGTREYCSCCGQHLD